MINETNKNMHIDMKYVPQLPPAYDLPPFWAEEVALILGTGLIFLQCDLVVSNFHSAPAMCSALCWVLAGHRGRSE